MNSTKLFSILILAIVCISRIECSSIWEDEEIDDEVVCPTPDAFIPHRNCTLYYRCSNGEPILQECPLGTYFNPRTDQCDFPAQVPECMGGTNSPPGTPGTTPIAIITTPGPVITTQAPPVETTQAPPVETTQAPPVETTQAPPVETTQAPPVETTQAPPVETTQAPPVETTQAPPVETTQAPPVETTQLPPIESTTTGSSFCPPTGIDWFPYPGNCSLYYFCANGVAKVEACATGLHFDKVDKQCKPMADANCDEEDPVFKCPPTGYEKYPHETNCSRYNLCVDGELHVQDCATGTYFDQDISNCNLAEKAVCHAECPDTGIHYIPIRLSKCKWYKICFDKESTNALCADDTIYSPAEERCVLSDSYTCPYGSRFWY